MSSAQSVTRPQLTVLRQQRGYLPELAPGGLLLRLDTRGQAMPAAEALSRRRQLLLDHLQIDPKPSQTGATAESRDGWISACLMAMDCVVAIQERLLLSVQESPRCRLLDQAGYLLFLPATPQSAASACQLLEHCLAAVFSDASATEVAGRWRAMAEVQEALRTSLPLTFNSLSTLRAARDLAIPSEVVAGSLCRYGWGARAVLMDGSLTQQTSAIGCNAAKNKLLAKILLRRAGLPVADGAAAGSPSQAWDQAQRLGLPVVVKPLTADGGVDVHVRLVNKDEVLQAAQAVVDGGHPILVEAYRPGRDYRLQIYRGRIFRCVERTPGGVVGDGVHAIRALLDSLNRQPDRGPEGSGRLKRIIDYDVEAERTLGQQGLTLDSVPEDGVVVPLRGAANVARGGELRVVDERVHPDNLELAVRAVEALGLDLAGVDLLIPDLERSWMEVGATICEVNAQPQMAANHADVLQWLVPEQGRIPVDVILGLPTLEPLRALHGEAGAGLGLVGPEGVFVDGMCFSRSPADQFEAVAMLLGCPRVSRLVIALWQPSLFNDGLPVDRFDRLIMLQPQADAADAADGAEQDSRILDQQMALLGSMAKTCYIAQNVDAIVDILRLPARDQAALDESAA